MLITWLHFIARGQGAGLGEVYLIQLQGWHLHQGCNLSTDSEHLHVSHACLELCSFFTAQLYPIYNPRWPHTWYMHRVTYGVLSGFPVALGYMLLPCKAIKWASVSTVTEQELQSSSAMSPEMKAKAFFWYIKKKKKRALTAMSGLHLLFSNIFLLDPENKAMLEWSLLLQA